VHVYTLLLAVGRVLAANPVVRDDFATVQDDVEADSHPELAN
jgi:hypothetical protein